MELNGGSFRHKKEIAFLKGSLFNEFHTDLTTDDAFSYIEPAHC